MRYPVKILLLDIATGDSDLIVRTCLSAGLAVQVELTTQTDLETTLRCCKFDLIVANAIQGSQQEWHSLDKAQSHAIPLIYLGDRPSAETISAAFRKRAADFVLRDSISALPIAIRRIQEQTNQITLHEQLLSLCSDAIIVRDTDDKITYWNKGAERLYGWSQEETLGRTSMELLCPEPNFESWPAVNEKCRQCGSWQGDLSVRKKSGAALVVSSNWISHVSDNGSSNVLLQLDSDRTECKHLEDQLIQAQKLDSIGTLAGGIAHDFNNILAAIQAATCLLKSDSRTADARDSLFHVVETSIRRGASLMKHLLTFARKHETQWSNVDINDQVAEVIMTIRETFPSLLTIDPLLQEDLPVVRADPTQIYQVLLNLCINARDAIGAIPGKISIRTGCTDRKHIPATHLKCESYVYISVEDDGSGMSAEVQRKLFEPFFTTKSLGSGTGLGLSVVYGIVKTHEGHIEVESASEVGTRFTVYFPAVRALAEAEVSTLADAPRTAPGRGEKILLVDDEPTLLNLLRQILKMNGYNVVVAHDGAEAVRKFSEEPDGFDLVLCDLDLPLMTGWEVIKAILETAPFARIIVSTGVWNRTMESELAAMGVCSFLAKPYEVGAALNMIRQCLDTVPLKSDARFEAAELVPCH